MRLSPRFVSTAMVLAVGAAVFPAMLLISLPALAVTAGNVKCKGCVSGKEIKKKAVRTRHVRKKAVTAKKLASGAVSTSRIEDRAVTIDKLSAEAAAAIAARNNVHNIVRVTQGGAATALAAGSAITTAIDAITDASETNRYLVQIGPGTWDMGSATVKMKPWVDIEGAGQGVTHITGAVADATRHTGVVEAADHAELRHVTVENSADRLPSPDTWRPAAILNDGVAARISYVSAVVSGEAGIGIHTVNSDDTRLEHVTATASNPIGVSAIRNEASTVALYHVNVDATGDFSIGINSTDSTVVVDGGYVKAGGFDDATGQGFVGGMGFLNFETNLTMNNLEIDVDGATPHCMNNRASDVIVNNVQGTARSGGARCVTTGLGGTTRIHNSRISGVVFSLSTSNGASTRVTNSQLITAPWQFGGDDKCFNTIDGNFAPLGSSCIP